MYRPVLYRVVISSNYVFNDTNARDLYFLSHIGELIDKMYAYIASNSELQQYDVMSTAWATTPNNRFIVEISQG